MQINQKLANAIIKQLESIYPDSLHDITQVLPAEKNLATRELIRKTLLILRDQGKITLDERGAAAGTVPILMNIRLVKL